MSSREFRPDLYVLARIIEVLVNNGPMRRTRLQLPVVYLMISLRGILSGVVSRGGLVMIDGDGLVRLTRDGERTYEELVLWIKRYVGSLRINRI